MGLDLNTALISDTFDGLIKTTDGNILTSSPLVITDGRGNDSSLALATAGNGVAITGTLTVGGVNIGSGLSTAQADITAIEAKTDFITVTGAVNLDTINTKAGFITVTQAVDLDTIESDIAVATAKTNFITVTQAVNLDTMESDILSAKTKTDFITISQAVNLDTVESGLATAQSDITAIEAKTDFITVSSNVNLNTIASNASAAKTKTDFLTVTQPVNLDTLESDVNVAKGDITAIEAKTDNITVTQAVNLDTMESDIADAKTKTDFITITQAVNLDTVESGLAQAQTDINQIEAKTNNITVTQAVNLDTMESDIAVNNAKNSYPAGDATKVGFISVTQAVDLDSMETDITNLSANKYDKTGGTISGSVVVTGDLTVNGTTTTVNTQTLSVKDPLIELANDNAANTVDTGFYANYSLDAGVTTKYAGLFKDASDSDKFKLFKGLEVEPTSSVNTSGTGYAKGDLVIGDLNADSGSISGTLSATTLGGTLSTAAQPNITSVGTLSSLTVSGALNGTLSTAAQPNITSVGTLSSLAVSGNLTVDTNTLYVDAANNRVGAGTTSPQANIHAVGTIKVATGNAQGILALGDGAGTTVNTGIWRGAANNPTSDGNYLNLGGYDGIVLATGNAAIGSQSEAMRIDSSGNVLIGDTGSGLSSAGRGVLEINGASSSILGLKVGGTVKTYLFQNGDDVELNNTANGILALKTNAQERMRIDSSGDIGIGTTDGDIFGRFYGRSVGIKATSGIGKLQIDGSSYSGIDLGQAGTRYSEINCSATNMVISTITNIPIVFGTGTSATERMRIDASGNVGIGTGSPSTKLQVVNNTADTNSAVNVLTLTQSTTGTAASGLGSGILFQSERPSGGIILDRGAIYGVAGAVDPNDHGDLAFYTLTNTGASGFSEKMRIDSSGKVGVGTSSPVATLDVLGTFGVSNSALSSWIFDRNGSGDLTITDLGASEKMRITSGGFLKASNDGTYVNSTASYHELRSSATNNQALKVSNSAGSSPYGMDVVFTASSPNNATNWFISCDDNAGSRFVVRSNGGIANYQANDANLSDERVKTDISPLGSYWDKFKALELVTFKYKDQTHQDDNIGLIAQQVESVAPEFVSNDGFGETPEGEEPLKTIYTADLYHATIKVLQEAMTKIENLEAEIATLKSQINA